MSHVIVFARFLTLFFMGDSFHSFSTLHCVENPRCIVLSKLYHSKKTDLSNYLVSLKASRYLHSKDAVNISRTFLGPQFFKYIPRKDEESAVVMCMNKRQKMRSESDDPNDKMNNNVIAVPGCPGIGKSTFLTNFPQSLAYQEYLHGKSPIVSGLTFNSKMDIGSLSFGLRIIFGACVFMGLVKDITTWTSFCEKFEGSIRDDYEVQDTIDILRAVFGADRPIIILVDEISKAEGNRRGSGPDQVCSMIGKLLNNYGDVDVVVSSLAPKYITELLTGSQRDVDFVVLPTLSTFELGRDYCEVWANHVIALAESEAGGQTLPLIKQNILRNVYLLYSGHPRSLAKMAFFFESVEFKSMWTEFGSKLFHMNPIQIFLWLVEYLPVHFGHAISSLSNEDLEEYIFTIPAKANVDSSSFRTHVDAGRLFLQKKDLTRNIFFPSVQALALLQLDTHKLVKNSRNLSKFLSSSIFLLNEITSRIDANKSSNGLSTIWERIVDLSVVGHSNYQDCSISELFGISIDPTIDRVGNLNIQSICKETKNVKYGKPVENCLIIPNSQTAGYDSLVVLFDPDRDLNLRFYLQMKIQSLSSLIAGVIVNCLFDHCRRTTLVEQPLSTVHMVLYLWGADETYCRSFRQEGLKEDVKILAVAKSKVVLKENRHVSAEIIGEFDTDVVTEYVEDCWDQVHFVGQEVLNDWINPSLLPLVQLVQKIETGSVCN